MFFHQARARCREAKAMWVRSFSGSDGIVNCSAVRFVDGNNWKKFYLFFVSAKRLMENPQKSTMGWLQWDSSMTRCESLMHVRVGDARWMRSTRARRKSVTWQMPCFWIANVLAKKWKASITCVSVLPQFPSSVNKLSAFYKSINLAQKLPPENWVIDPSKRELFPKQIIPSTASSSRKSSKHLITAKSKLNRKIIMEILWMGAVKLTLIVGLTCAVVKR